MQLGGIMLAEIYEIEASFLVITKHRAFEIGVGSPCSTLFGSRVAIFLEAGHSVFCTKTIMALIILTGVKNNNGIASAAIAVSVLYRARIKGRGRETVCFRCLQIKIFILLHSVKGEVEAAGVVEKDVREADCNSDCFLYHLAVQSDFNDELSVKDRWQKMITGVTDKRKIIE
jgi:hypothetical protein